MVDLFLIELTKSVIGIENEISIWMNDHLFNILLILLGALIVRRFGVKLGSQLFNRTVRKERYASKIEHEKRIQTLSSLSSAFMRVSVYVIAIILIIGELNPGYMTALFASAGLITIALGFGAQSLIRDFMSGIFIITENQYRIGDEITLTAGMGMGDVNGTVEEITIRTTVLRDLDGNLHHVPNGNIGMTTNKTMGFSRINETIAVAADTDLERLEHIIKHVGEELMALPELKGIILEAPYLASVKGFTDNGLLIKVIGKTAPAEQWKVRSEFYKRLKKEFAKADIKLPKQN